MIDRRPTEEQYGRAERVAPFGYQALEVALKAAPSTALDENLPRRRSVV